MNISDLLNFIILGVLGYLQLSVFIQFCVFPSAGGFFQWLFMFTICFFTAIAPFEFRVMSFAQIEAPLLNHKYWRAGVILAIAFFYIPAYWSHWTNIMISVGSLLLMICGVVQMVFSFLDRSPSKTTVDKYNAYSNQGNFQQQYSYSSQHMPQYTPAPYTPTQLPETLPSSQPAQPTEHPSLQLQSDARQPTQQPVAEQFSQPQQAAMPESQTTAEIGTVNNVMGDNAAI